MSAIIDIHPHIVSPDTKKYPLDPLGGTQSTWSSERPTTYDDLLRAMDDAGVAKAAIVHSSTAYGYDNSYVADAVQAVPARFTGVYSIDVLAPDAVKTFDHWLGRGCSGMRLFTTGSTLPDQATWFADPKTYPFWEHAAAKNIPVCVQMKQEGIPLLRQIMDKFPKVTIILDHLSRTPFEDGPPYAGAADFLALAKYKQVYLKITPINVTPKSWGKAHPGDVLRQVDRHLRRRAHRLGIEFPQLGRNAEGNPDRGAEGVFLRQVERSGLDLRQDSARTVSPAEELMRRGAGKPAVDVRTASTKAIPLWLYAAILTYSKSPGRLSMPTLGGAIHEANWPGSLTGFISEAMNSPSAMDGSHLSFCLAQAA